MAAGKKPVTHHVVPNAGGGWDIRSSGHYDTKQDAVQRAREISRNSETELKIHNRDGRIPQSDSHGNDPRSIKG